MLENNVAGHRKRLREKYLKSGIEGLHDYEILELLTTYAIPRKDCKPIAKEILNKYGSVSEFFNDLEYKNVVEIEGIGDSGFVLYSLINDIIKFCEREKIYTLEKITSTHEVVDYLRKDLGANKKEIFKILFLDSKNSLIKDENIFEGTINKSHIYPREIVKKVIDYNALSVILVHNHPSGNTTPSNEDIGLTNKLKHTLDSLDIRVLDHIIISRTGYYSFLENNLL